MNRRLFFSLLALGISRPASAEQYLNFEPLDTLGDLRKKLPGATFARLAPAWAAEYEALYKISGSGLSGLIFVKFDDSRALYRIMASDQFQADAAAKKGYEAKVRDLDDNAALTLSWLRWNPDAPVPFERLFQKFGAFDEKGVAADDFKPYRGWRRRGVRATLSDDEKTVLFIEYHFNLTEMAYALRRKGIDPVTSVTNAQGTIYLPR